MTFLLWIPVLLAAVWAAHWGAEHLSAPLKKLRRKWGISVIILGINGAKILKFARL